MAKKAGNHPNYGGKREGAGRPSETLSVRQAREFEEAQIKLAEEFGMSLSERVGRIGHDPQSSNRDVCMAANLIWKYSVIVGSEGGEADQALVPAVFLPSKHPRLELVDDGTSSSDK